MGYSAYFLIQSGVAIDKAFDFTIIQFAIGFFATCCSFFVVQRVGRRTLYLGGLAALFVLLMITGGLGVMDTLDENALATNPQISVSIAALLLVFTFVYDVSIGPACYVVVSEISSTDFGRKQLCLLE